MIEIFIIGICLAANAFLSMSEMAFVTVRKSKLEHLGKNGSRAAQKVLSLRKNPERTLSVIQIGITLVGAIAAAVGGAGAESFLTPWLEKDLGMSPGFSESLSIIIVVIPITYLSVVIGELVPKSLAIKNSTPIVISVVPILVTFDKFLSPIVSLLEKSTKLITRFFGSEEKEIGQSLPEAIELESLSPETREAILRHSKLQEKSAKDVMTPWKDVRWIHRDTPDSKVREILVQSGHARIPVFCDDTVIGILHAKDFFSKIDSQVSWLDLIRPPLHIQMRTPLPRVLTILQRGRAHIAILLDEERLIGIVSMEDIIEEVFGEFYEDAEPDSVQSLLSRRRRG